MRRVFAPQHRPYCSPFKIGELAARDKGFSAAVAETGWRKTRIASARSRPRCRARHTGSARRASRPSRWS